MAQKQPAGSATATALELFDRTVARRPHSVAIVDPGRRSLTWSEVARAADGVAAFLRKNGVGSGDRVACALQNEVEYILTIVAAWRAGASVVPVNPMWRSREFAHLLHDSDASAVITTADLWTDVIEPVRTPSLRVALTVDAATETSTLFSVAEQCCSTERLEPAPGPSDAAYVTYTSGTTGAPKGAINTHANVAWNATVLTDIAELNADDVCVTLAPFFHVTGLVAEIAASFASGLRLVLTGRFEPLRAAQLIAEHHATYVIASITAFRSLLDGLGQVPRDLSSLRRVYSGGAPMMPSVLKEFDVATGAYIHNIYGLTETTSPSHMVPPGSIAPTDPHTGAVSVGKVTTGTQCVVTDEDGTVLPIGELGELVIRGPQVFAGYLGNPEATRAAFGPHGFRTGDIGYVDADGWFYVVDRLKDMINASGYKVWPREVEDVLCEHPSVSEAAVVGAADEYRGETVVAFVVARDGAALDADELLEWSRQRLATYKRPRRITVLDDLPKNAAGKLLRRELRR